MVRISDGSTHLPSLFVQPRQSNDMNSYLGSRQSTALNLPIVAFIACSDWSMPIHLLFSRCADFRVVPEPQKQSKTTLSGLEEVLIIRSNRAGFFFRWIGWGLGVFILPNILNPFTYLLIRKDYFSRVSPR